MPTSRPIALAALAALAFLISACTAPADHIDIAAPDQARTTPIANTPRDLSLVFQDQPDAGEELPDLAPEREQLADAGELAEDLARAAGPDLAGPADLRQLADLVSLPDLRPDPAAACTGGLTCIGFTCPAPGAPPSCTCSPGTWSGNACNCGNRQNAKPCPCPPAIVCP